MTENRDIQQRINAQLGKKLLTDADFSERIEILESELDRRGKALAHFSRRILISAGIVALFSGGVILAGGIVMHDTSCSFAGGVILFLGMLALAGALYRKGAARKNAMLLPMLGCMGGIGLCLYLTITGDIDFEDERHNVLFALLLFLPVLFSIVWACLKMLTIFPRLAGVRIIVIIGASIGFLFIFIFGIYYTAWVLGYSGDYNNIPMRFVFFENEILFHILLFMALAVFFLMNLFAICAAVDTKAIFKKKVDPFAACFFFVKLFFLILIAICVVCFFRPLAVSLLELVFFPELFLGIGITVFCFFAAPFYLTGWIFDFFGGLKMRSWSRNAAAEIERMKQELGE